MAQHTPYIVVNQSRDRAPTDYENLLGDALERAFASGVTELGPLIEALNEMVTPSPAGQPWTEELFLSEMKRLGA